MLHVPDTWIGFPKDQYTDTVYLNISLSCRIVLFSIKWESKTIARKNAWVILREKAVSLITNRCTSQMWLTNAIYTRSLNWLFINWISIFLCTPIIRKIKKVFKNLSLQISNWLSTKTSKHHFIVGLLLIIKYLLNVW